MTLVSMTGYGHAICRSGNLRVDVEINSVNRKQLDLSIQLPRTLQALEPAIGEKVSHGVVRGRVSVSVDLAGHDGASVAKLHLNEELARSFVKKSRAFAAKVGIEEDLSLSDLLRVPGILTAEEVGSDIAKVSPLVMKAVESALKKFNAMRMREGRSLAADLSGRLAALGRQVATIEKRVPSIVRSYRGALRERVKNLAGDLGIADERLEKEVVIFADKSDITEELTRLKSHLDQARSLIKSREAVGRSLDFLVQEMLREINTIGSKSTSAAVAHDVVRFKSELERFREQVQNIE